MEIGRTFVGLDVHTRSVLVCGLDDRTGGLSKARLLPDNETILAWVRGLAALVAVVYEAGSTGYGLAQFLTGHGVRCVVTAPSKLHRPDGDRVKTDAEDALLLARLLRLGEITAVTVPSLAQEAARDLVRVREDVRSDLTRAASRARSPSSARPTPGGCWSRPPGTTAGPTLQRRPCGPR